MWGAKPAKMVLRDCKGKQGAHVPFWKRSSFGLSSGIIWERAGVVVQIRARRQQWSRGAIRELSFCPSSQMQYFKPAQVSFFTHL